MKPHDIKQSSQSFKSYVEEYVRLKKVAELEELEDQLEDNSKRSLDEIEADMERLAMEQKEQELRDKAQREEQDDSDSKEENKEIPQHIKVVKEVS